MTDEESRLLSRRTFLLVSTSGMATLAGCGYRPGNGDKRWETGHIYDDYLEVVDGVVVGADYGSSYEEDDNGIVNFQTAAGSRDVAITRFDQAIQSMTVGEQTGFVLLSDGKIQTLEIPDPDDHLSEDVIKESMDEISPQPIGTVGQDVRDVLTAGETGYVVMDSGAVNSFESDGTNNWDLKATENPLVQAAGEKGVTLGYDEIETVRVIQYTSDGALRWEQAFDLDFEVKQLVMAGGYLYIMGRKSLRVDIEAETATTMKLPGDTKPVFGPEGQSMYLIDQSASVLSKVDVETGRIDWQRYGAIGQPASDGDVVFTPSVYGLQNLDAETGDVNWEEETIDDPRVLGVSDEWILTVDDDFNDLVSRYR